MALPSRAVRAISGIVSPRVGKEVIAGCSKFASSLAIMDGWARGDVKGFNCRGVTPLHPITVGVAR